ncbi:MAG TPA: oligosaccharide flippase family protein [Candidatus Sulfotelmatobacter sp.]|nr:oligosaccharide flippase family protein [Candidatus Sulfotelmatobacter sp.]
MAEIQETRVSSAPPAGTAQSRTKALRQKLLGGSLTLLAGSGLVGVTNLIYNVVTARMLGPTGFAHATAVYTLLMLASAITLSFQVVCAKYVASHESESEKAAIFARLHMQGWIAGVGIGFLLFLFNGAVQHYLNLPNPALISLLALGTAFYIPLGVRRGYIQGVHAFRGLALNFMLEGLTRLGGAYLLILLGLGVQGAVLASVIAVIASYLLAKPTPPLQFRARRIPMPFGEGVQAIVFFSGQVVINNFDIVLVKHFFSSDEAGIYAAVSLVGRLVNMCAWSVVNTMFPVSAGSRSSDREARPVLFMSLFLVFLILSVLTLGLWVIPSFLWRTLFGAHFQLGNYGGLAALLILYAITTGIYSLSSVMITYEMSRKIANTSWVQLAFSGALVLGIWVFHQNLRQVIFVQLVLMIILFVMVALPLLRKEIALPEDVRSYPNLAIARSLNEHEVIAEFLRSEFHHPEFEEYRADFERLVNHPDLNSHRENALRRALLFLRRGAMWRELPDDTQWFQVKLERNDLERIRFFPRAQWRRVAEGSFYLTDMIECLRQKWQESPHDEFFQKLRRMSDPVREGSVNPTVLLIGVDERSPLTILDGNHRMAAAMLAQPPAALDSLQFICGFSPSMTRCCWYKTNVNTLSRYLTNLLRHIFYDPESDIGRFMESGS